jgi:hypothetical protein
MVSFIERCQSVLAGAVLALLVASVVLVPQNRALGEMANPDPVIICPARCVRCGNPVEIPGGGRECQPDDAAFGKVTCHPPGVQGCKYCGNCIVDEKVIDLPGGQGQAVTYFCRCTIVVPF